MVFRYKIIIYYKAKFLSLVNNTKFNLKKIGMINNSNTIYKSKINTPIGDMIVCATDFGICALIFEDENRSKSVVEEISKSIEANIVNDKNKHLTQVEKELNEYFEGKRKEFSVALDLQGTDFRKLVWNQLLKVPYGEARSYKDQAIAMNKLTAIRAIASANGANKIEIIVPCHRIIGTNGNLTGYAGGLDRKKWLLDLEKNY